jgi:hypothetical protein
MPRASGAFVFGVVTDSVSGATEHAVFGAVKISAMNDYVRHDSFKLIKASWFGQLGKNRGSSSVRPQQKCIRYRSRSYSTDR